MTAAESADETADLTSEGQIARAFLTRIGERIRELRQARALTMQQLADRAHISRRLLTQIEHGQANPSLVTITRLARELGTDFTNLLDGAATSASPVEVFDADEQVLVWSGANGSTAHLLVSTRDTRAADLWLWRLAPGDTYHGHADPERSQELFYVLQGTLTVSVDGMDVLVPEGSASRLRSDRAYSYLNAGHSPAVFVRTVALHPS